MKRTFRFEIGQQVKHGSIITRVTNRELGAISLAPYYKVTNSNHWIVEEDLDYYEPLADWEKALLADWFAIGDRVTSKYGHRQGTIVDFDYAPDKTHPGVKWDGQTGDKSLHYLPSDLIKVEQDTMKIDDEVQMKWNEAARGIVVAVFAPDNYSALQVRVDWETGPNRDEAWTQHPIYELELVKDTNMLIPIGTKVEHYRDAYRGKGTVINHIRIYNKVRWDDGLGNDTSHESDYLKVIEFEQIKGDDPRLKEFWEEARKEADRLGFCGEYEKLATKLQTPKPKTEIRKITVSIPVEITVEVEVEVGKEPLSTPISQAVQDLSDIREKLKASVDFGGFSRSAFKISGGF